MLSTIIHAPGDIRLEERPAPTILEPTTPSYARSRPVCAGLTCGATAGFKR
jgi:hypothetical protein